MPTRYLKPGIRDSERMEAISDPNAEILYYRLLVSVDDYGRTDGRPLMVKSLCFPVRMRATADKCANWLKDLERAGLLRIYEADGKPYIQIEKWDNKPRAEHSKYPEPPTLADNCMQMLPVTVTVTGTKTETENKKPALARFALPDWIPEEHWRAWIEARTKSGKPPTDYAKRLAVKKLENMREEGHPPAQVLMNAAFNNWSGLFPPKEVR